MNNIEKKSIINGNIVVVDPKGKAYSKTNPIYYVWYKKENEDYKILLKTFNCNKKNVEEKKEKIKEKIKGNVGIGILDINNQRMDLMKP